MLEQWIYSCNHGLYCGNMGMFGTMDVVITGYIVGTMGILLEHGYNVGAVDVLREQWIYC